MYFTVNKHKWPGSKLFKKCAHECLSKEDERTVQWLTEDSGGQKAIKSVILHKDLKRDIQYLTRTVNTTSVEVFNNLLLKYLPKQYHFEYERMQFGAYLTAIDTNNNVSRSQAVVSKSSDESTIGKKRFKIAWKKATKKRVARIVYEAKSYNYLKKGMLSVYKRAEFGKKRKSKNKRAMAPT